MLVLVAGVLVDNKTMKKITENAKNTKNYIHTKIMQKIQKKYEKKKSENYKKKHKNAKNPKKIQIKESCNTRVIHLLTSDTTLITVGSKLSRWMGLRL